MTTKIRNRSQQFGESQQSEQMENFVRSRINYKYNKQMFDKQLNETKKKNLNKLQKQTIRLLKRKLTLELINKQQLVQNNSIINKRQEKINKSREKRQQNILIKCKSIIIERQLRKKLFLSRLDEVHQQKQDRIFKQINKINQQEKNAIQYNTIKKSTNLIQQSYSQELLGKRSSDLTNMNKLKQILDEKMSKRKFSLQSMKSMKSLKVSSGSLVNSAEIARYNNSSQTRMESHLDRISKLQMKKELKIEQQNKQHIKKIIQNQIEPNTSKIKSKSVPKLTESQEVEQKNKSQYFMQKLRRSYRNQNNQQQDLENKKLVSHEISRIKIEPTLQPTRNSIIFEQSEQKTKYSYRKQIVQQIKQYMKQRRQNLMLY